MAFIYSSQTIDSILFKKVIFGKSSSDKNRNPTEEGRNTQANIFERQLVKFSKYIPTLSPPTFQAYTGITGNYVLNGFQLTGASEVSFYYDNSIPGYTGPLLIKITGLPYLADNPVDKFFYHPSIRNIVPFNYASNYYDYVVRNNSNQPISATNSSAWYLDPESGTITLFEVPDTTGITPASPPKLDIIVYAGPMGVPDADSNIGANSTGYVFFSDGISGIFRPEFPENQYREDNFIGVTTININHNYNQKPYVSVVDRFYNNIILYDLKYIDNNNINVSFSQPHEGIIITQGSIGSIHGEQEIVENFFSETSVIIKHNWDKNPEVKVFDLSWNEIGVYDLIFENTDTIIVSFNIAQSGYIVLNGSTWPNQPKYLETSFVSTTTVNITHNFGKRPSVTVIDSLGNKVFFFNATHTLNSVNITFSLPQTGTVILQGSYGAKDPHTDKSMKMWERGITGGIKNRGRNVVTGDNSLSIGFGNAVAGNNSFIFGYNNTLLSNNSSILGGQGITGIQNDTSFIPRIAILQGITLPAPINSISSQGITGEIWFDNDYLYVKTSDPINPWKRTSINVF